MAGGWEDVLVQSISYRWLHINFDRKILNVSLHYTATRLMSTYRAMPDRPRYKTYINLTKEQLQKKHVPACLMWILQKIVQTAIHIIGV